MLSCFFVTVWTSECAAHQAPLSMGFLQQEYWSGFLRFPPGHLPDPGFKHMSPALQVDSLPLSHRGSPRSLLVAQSYLTFCDPIYCSTSGFPVLHHLLNFLSLMSIELVMPSNHLILCHPLLLLPSVFPSIKVFSNWVSSSHQVTKVLELQLQYQSFQWIFRTDFL